MLSPFFNSLHFIFQITPLLPSTSSHRLHRHPSSPSKQSVKLNSLTSRWSPFGPLAQPLSFHKLTSSDTIVVFWPSPISFGLCFPLHCCKNTAWTAGSFLGVSRVLLRHEVQTLKILPTLQRKTLKGWVLWINLYILSTELVIDSLLSGSSIWKL